MKMRRTIIQGHHLVPLSHDNAESRIKFYARRGIPGNVREKRMVNTNEGQVGELPWHALAEPFQADPATMAGFVPFKPGRVASVAGPGLLPACSQPRGQGKPRG